MNLNPFASNLVVVWYLSLSLVLTGVVIGLTLALHKLNARLEALTSQVEPVLQKADLALALANEKLESIGSATESLLAHTEAVATTVEAKTETTSRLVQKTIHAPFVSANALLAGVAAGAKALRAGSTARVLQSPKPQTPLQEEPNHGKQ
ncbi:hypothetical protein [Armatimonas rosea]|uniref:Uncharacterized protein YoxC n=1 Tax=Armatimonas rosea TaxID=685828 RepID=A0A7W9SU54_ARMRO|nr:hypothetical protein [Armatimonas rosea]MBB6052465.1 uncharacterized protein YoxC [Armatimonas rosea]